MAVTDAEILAQIDGSLVYLSTLRARYVSRINDLNAEIANLKAQLAKGFVSRAVAGQVVPIGASGLLVTGAVGRATTGQIGVTTGTPMQTTLPLASFKPFPTIQWKDPVTGQQMTGQGFLIDRTKAFPQYIAGVRANYFVGPANAVLELIAV